MGVPEVRIRRETFGFTLAFGDGHIGFYGPEVGPLLLEGASQSTLEPYRVHHLPVPERFHLSAPLIVWFEITRGCNLPCRHCYIEAGPVRAQELSTAEVFGVLDQLHRAGVFALVLVGGEPMARPDFCDIVQYASRLGFVISIATNGTLLTQEIIDALPPEECIVSVSVDGTALHQELRIKSTFEELREKLLLLKHNDIPTALMCTQTSTNVHELGEVLSFAEEHRFFFGSTPFSTLGRGRFFPQYQPGLDVVEPAAQLYLRDTRHDASMMKTVGLCVAKFLDECHRVAQATGREFCGVAMAYVLSDGSVYPCSICASTESFVAGNVRDQSFADIWEHSFTDIREFTFDKFKECPGCELSKVPYYCTSRCPVMAQMYTSDPLGCGATPYVKASLKRRTNLLHERQSEEE